MYNRNNIFGYGSRKKEIQRRIWTIMIILIFLFCFLIWRSIYNMYLQGPSRKAMADAQYRIDESYGLLYNLIDCKGRDLLDYVVNYYAVIDPVDYLRFNEYTSKYDLEALTITLRNYNSNYDLEKIKNTGSFEKIKYKIDEDTYDKLKDIKEVKGFYTYPATEVIRDKPWKVENLLSNPKYYKDRIDTVTKKQVSDLLFKSDDSLEMQIYNKTKNNEYTKIRFNKGINGEISKGSIIQPKSNTNVKLTLDKEIQDKVESILHEKKYDQVGVVLMESETGKIRAMAQKDDNAYNANIGIPTTNGFFAGSIFKVIVDEAGIDMNLIDNNKIYTVDDKIFPGGHEILGKYTLTEALSYSSNNIFAQLGMKVGYQNIYKYAQKQGVGSKVLNLHYEQSGKFEMDSTESGDISLLSIGLKVRMTPLQAISVSNTIINKGKYVQPSIIESYIKDNNEILKNTTFKTNSILEEKTAETVKLHMIDVVNKGTGKQAYIKGMGIGGKTGTSEYNEKGKKYSDGWFVGFFNLHGKNYSMVVFVKNIDLVNEEGGNTAAPIFKEIVNAINRLKDME
jgi:cell division protein FtsI/penicillin-binding protein 2